MPDYTDVSYQGFAPSAANQEFVNRHVEKFEKSFDRITSCSIVIAAPGHRHRNDGCYRVSIRIKLPAGKEVDITRVPNADERYADFHFAVNDAFKRAKRQLRGKVEHLRGDVKSHEAPPTGVVSQVNEDHGFIATPEGQEIYFHRNSVLNDSFRRLVPGTHVTFASEMGEKGLQASTVRISGGKKPPAAQEPSAKP